MCLQQQEMKVLEEKYGQLKTQYKDKSDKLKVFRDKNTVIKSKQVVLHYYFLNVM